MNVNMLSSFKQINNFSSYFSCVLLCLMVGKIILYTVTSYA